jgi:hypothetical protein
LTTDYDWILDVQLANQEATERFTGGPAYAETMRDLAAATKFEWTARMSHTMHGL